METNNYWLKLNKDFMKHPKIKFVKSMPNGKEYIIYYLSLILECIKTPDQLRFDGLIPCHEYMLSKMTNTNMVIIKAANEIFITLGLMELLDDITVYETQIATFRNEASN